MDDLTTLKGIGKATAKRLVNAGISSFAALATASPDQFQAIDKLGSSPTEWADWVAEAKKRVPPAPVDLEKATPDQVKNQAALIDAARVKLTEAGTAAATAQGSGDAGAIEAARLAVEAAQAELDGLIGPGSTSQNSPHTTASEGEDGEAGETAAGLPGSDATTVPSEAPAETGPVPPAGFNLAENFGSAVAALDQRAIALFNEVSPEAASAFLAEQLDVVDQLVTHMTKMRGEIIRLQAVVTRTESIWPVDLIRFDGIEQPIGQELKVDPKTASALLAGGAALDHDPAKKPGSA